MQLPSFLPTDLPQSKTILSQEGPGIQSWPWKAAYLRLCIIYLTLFLKIEYYCRWKVEKGRQAFSYYQPNSTICCLPLSISRVPLQLQSIAPTFTVLLLNYRTIFKQQIIHKWVPIVSPRLVPPQVILIQLYLCLHDLSGHGHDEDDQDDQDEDDRIQKRTEESACRTLNKMERK